jgi:hypothetical protein
MTFLIEQVFSNKSILLPNIQEWSHTNIKTIDRDKAEKYIQKLLKYQAGRPRCRACWSN